MQNKYLFFWKQYVAALSELIKGKYKIEEKGYPLRYPKKILQTLKISTDDYIEIDIENGQAVLKPRKLIDPSQGWFWTNEWQALAKKIR